MKHRSTLRLALFFACLVSWGCDSPPAAPALSDSPVYQNASEGFRFLVPEGWIQSASSVLPAGPISKEVFLARYKLSTPEPGATLQILCVDETMIPDLQTHHAQGSFSAAAWDIVEPSQSSMINGVSSERVLYVADLDGKSMSKLVVGFRRKGRIYCFVGMYWSKDDHAAQQIQRALSSVKWE